jgi:urate oxidase
VPVFRRVKSLKRREASNQKSVQATLYKMADKVLQENGDIEAVSYVLPNKHYVPVEMGYIGIENMEPLSIMTQSSPFFLFFRVTSWDKGGVHLRRWPIIDFF